MVIRKGVAAVGRSMQRGSQRSHRAVSIQPWNHNGTYVVGSFRVGNTLVIAVMHGKSVTLAACVRFGDAYTAAEQRIYCATSCYIEF